MKIMLKRNSMRVPALLLLLAPAGPLGASATIGETVGTAYDLKSGELLYRETHCISADGQQREVLYQDGNDELIARKLVDYQSGATTPSFVQQNHYSRESIEVALQQGTVSMAVIDDDHRDAHKPVIARPSEDSPLVIDAGFDAFVRRHWDELVSGASREFQFPFAERSSLVEMRIQPLACDYATQTDQCFRLDLANWFLRMVVKPIELGYDPGSRRLTRYRGLSNIGDGKGNGLVVDIHYDYAGIAPQACQQIMQSQSGKAAANALPRGQS